MALDRLLGLIGRSRLLANAARAAGVAVAIIPFGSTLSGLWHPAAKNPVDSWRSKAAGHRKGWTGSYRTGSTEVDLAGRALRQPSDIDLTLVAADLSRPGADARLEGGRAELMAAVHLASAAAGRFHHPAIISQPRSIQSR